MSVLAVGLMSGTSADGVDAALVRIEESGELSLVAFVFLAYAASERVRLLDAIERGTPRELATVDVWLGERFADAVERVLAEAGAKAKDLKFIACHGHTFWHEPGKASLQLGNPAVLAERFGVTVVSDFRSRDVAAGGQGAPLVPIADACLFGHPQKGRALLNLGGMANVTWVPRLGDVDGTIAFDTGPGMAVIDCVVRKLVPDLEYDVGGVLAASGRAVEEAVRVLLSDPFFGLPPPKSTGRERFGTAFAERLIAEVSERLPDAAPEDMVATAVELTARSVADQIERWLPRGERSELLVSGGGAKNRWLMERLAQRLAQWEVVRFEDVFFDGDAKEAAAFAFLGWLTLHGRPGNVPRATGARGPRVLGRITPA
ncbi:Anhydro-N-acetylmuramic acid kinase [bacterium HR33]|nr:Anhydro-N-acetylmuramic acid kinase [bacterium HR33]